MVFRDRQAGVLAGEASREDVPAAEERLLALRRRVPVRDALSPRVVAFPDAA